jgi:predicted small secreted protein
MKKFRNFVSLFVILAAFGTLASCNRGYGCPTDLKAAAQVVGTALQSAK